ncbi:MAG: hypothetical protein H6828_11495 [Planctomycetes bacterium]|nr:hypothetical protein [Planctomycetota bacterium]
MRLRLRPGALLAPFVLVLLATLGLAQEVVVTRGSGTSQRDAVKHALAEAVCQVNGASVETRSSLRQEVRDVLAGIESEFTYSAADDLDVVTASRGHVRSYEVISSAPSAGGTEVTVRAVVLRFDPDNPRPGQKKTVVVERFDVAAGALQLPGEVEGAPALLSFLQDGLTTRLVRSRKFTVLTRKNLAPILKEHGFLRTDDVEPGERVKLGQLLGADYLLAGRVDYLAVRTDRQTVKLTGYVIESKHAEVRLTLTVYNVGSGAIEWEDSVTRSFDWDGDELKRDAALRDDGAIARSLLELSSEELGGDFLKRTFPPRVMLVDTERPLKPVFYLNAGDALVRVGEEFDLVRPGEQLVDPDTGDVLGAMQTRLGRVVVVEVTPKLSKARFVDPSDELLERVNAAGFDASGLVCLPAK